MGAQAHAQSTFVYTATVNQAADLGSIAAASSGQTVFRVTPSGSVSRVSGNGTRITSGSITPVMVTVTCDSSTSQCRDTNLQVTISSTGSPTNRAGSLTNFTVQAGTGLTIVSGPTGTNPISFTTTGVTAKTGGTFFVGFDMPILGDDSAASSGLSRSSFSIVATATSATAGTASGSAQAQVVRNLTMTSLSNMGFGRLTLPSSGTQQITLSPITQAISVSGSGSGVNVWSTPVPTAAQFRISGEGGRAFSISLPTTVTLTGPAGSTPITVTPIASASGAQVLSGASGSAGTFDLWLGGSFPVSASTLVGAYSGSVVVTVQYN